MLERVIDREKGGMILAQDNSGGSTPGALAAQGVERNQYTVDGTAEGEINPEKMFDLMHALRSRVMQTEIFNGENMFGTILFEGTLNKQIDGISVVEHAWKRGVVSFLKVDKGLEEEKNGVRLMKDMGDLEATLDQAGEQGVFGTKMRSFIARPDEAGIQAIVDQQIEYGKRITAKGMVPILEPEVDINSSEKRAAEQILKQKLMAGLDTLEAGQEVMLKLTIPEEDNFYQALIDHPRVLRVVALSGGYDQATACAKLARQHGMAASFSRASYEGLDMNMEDAEYDCIFAASVGHIVNASNT